MKEPIWVLKLTVLKIHDAQIAEHGGVSGLLDEGLLESALCQAFHLFLYAQASLFEIATAYAERIVKNHPFIDGNKRTAYIVAMLFLNLNGYELTAPKKDRVIKFIELASGSIIANEFSSWLEDNSKQLA